MGQRAGLTLYVLSLPKNTAFLALKAGHITYAYMSKRVSWKPAGQLSKVESHVKNIVSQEIKLFYF